MGLDKFFYKQKLVLLIIITWFLAGCSNDLSKAKQDVMCEDKGGVYQYSDLAFKGYCTCNDGSYSESWTTKTGPKVAEALKQRNKKAIQ